MNSYLRSRTCLATTSFAIILALFSCSAKAQDGLAVVELFTSQGCSSCPPADRVLSEIQTQATDRKLEVYVLSFHVDYWNRLGWDDPYSSPEFSRRQRTYANVMGSDRVYTPQMIVNGAEEFVGSRKSTALSAINDSLKQKPRIKVSLPSVKSIGDGKVKVDYQMSNLAEKQVLNFALVHTPKANAVPRGENGGRKLEHVNVVRAYKTIALTDQSGSIQLEVPSDVQLSSAKVIAYVQGRTDAKVIGAAEKSVQL